MQGFDVHMYVFFYVLTLDVLYASFLCRTKARYVVYICHLIWQISHSNMYFFFHKSIL